MGFLKSRIKLLSLSVATTVVLLAIGAGLVVLGIFNEYLRGYSGTTAVASISIRARSSIRALTTMAAIAG